MSNFLKNLVGIATAEEENNVITVGGAKVTWLARDITRFWSTSKVAEYMFRNLSDRKIVFDSFFAPDVLFVLDAIQKDRYTRTNSAVLNHVRNLLIENTWLARTQQPTASRLDTSKLKLFKKSPLPHQQEFFEVYDTRTQRFGLRGYLLSAAAGSGKTLTQLMLAEMLGVDHIVLIVPKNSVYKVWQNTLETEYHKKPEYWIAGDNRPYQGQRYIVGHYEALDRVSAVVRKLEGGFYVGLDESHNFNEVTSLRTQLFCDMCREIEANHVIWSSGTPVKALGYETVPLMRTIDPLFTQLVEERYKRIFGRNASRALDILQHRVGMVSFRVEKKGVVDNRERTIERRIRIPNGDDYTLDTVRDQMRVFITERLNHYKNNRKYYEQDYQNGLEEFSKTLVSSQQKKDFDYYKSCVSRIAKGYDPVLHKTEAAFCNQYELKTIMPTLKQPLREEFRVSRSVIKYVHLKVMGEALGTVVGKKRAQCHVDMIPHMGLGEIINDSLKKTVIFTSFVSAAVKVDELLKLEKFKPVLVYGQTNANLPQLIDSFEKDPKVNPVIATYQSLSTAVPLIVANTAVFINAPFRDHERVQARARIDRLGQDTEVFFYEMYLDTGNKPNISTRSKDILEWSKDQIAAIMGQETGLKTLNLFDNEIATESLVVSVEAEELALEAISPANPYYTPPSARW